MSTIPPKTPHQPQKPTEHVNRACEPCRVLKVRCLPSTDPSAAQCQRCAKNGRTCHYAAPQKRRPRKRTDTRVAELEREVRAMRSLLNKSKQSPTGESIQDSIGTVEEREEPENLVGMDAVPSMTISPEILNAKGSWGGSECDYDHSDGGAERSPDVIERDLICLTRAVKFFDHYNDNMQLHAPIVTFRPDETADSVRTNKPVLFLTILTAAAGQLDQPLYSTLHEELLSVFAERYILNCGKSLELVQSFLITAVWLYPPNDFRALKFYQYVHMAASMVLDIGQSIMTIGPPKPWPILLPINASKATQDALKDMEGCYPNFPTRAPANLEEERLVVENKRTFLACYLLCSSVSLSLRRPNMLTYSSATAECIDVLEKSPHALPSDKHLIVWVRMQHIAEECGTSFSFDDQTGHFGMSDPRLQLILKGFENRLEEYKNSLDLSSMSPTLALHYYTNKIFLQEYAVMIHNGPDFLSPQSQNMNKVKTRPITTASTNATMTVIESAHFLLDAFLGASDASLKCYPVINYVRMAYSCVLLIKIFAASSAPNSELGKILDPNALKVDEYLKAIVSRLQNLTEYRVGNKFLQIIVKVAMWHQQHLNSSIAKLGQGHGQLIQPLLNMVVEDDERKAAIKCILGSDKGNADMKNGNCLPSLESRTKLGLSSSPGLGSFATDIFSFNEAAPSEQSTISGNESTYTQATTATTAASTLGVAPGAPGVASDDAHLQFFLQPPDMTYGLLPTDMDMDIFALSEGMEYSAADLSTWLPPDEGWRYPQSFGTAQDWNWEQL